MGSFGWNCSVCDNPVLGDPRPGYKKFNRAVVLFPSGDRISGEYDGYGRVGAFDLIEEGGRFKLLHKCCHTGQTYDQLKESGHDGTQAGGYDEAGMVTHYGPPDLSEIKQPRRYACTLCRETFLAKFSGGVCPSGCKRPACPDHGQRTVKETCAAAWAKAGPGQPCEHVFENLCRPCLAQHEDHVVELRRDETLSICGHEECRSKGEPGPVEVLTGEAADLFEPADPYHPTRCKSCGKRDKLTILTLKAKEALVT